MLHPKILIAGFGTWARAEVNPASLLVQEMARQKRRDCTLICEEIPVSTKRLGPILSDLLETHQPDYWLGLGVSSRGSQLELEMVGINWRNFDVVDVDGALIKATKIVEDGPTAYNAQIPNEAICKAIQAMGIPVHLSFHAGTHLCNQMLYTACHLVETGGYDTKCGFMHVPQTSENIDKSNQPHESCLPLSIMLEAVETCVDGLVADAA